MIVFVVIFGLLVGSFLNVCIFRIPLGRSIVLPSSFCPFCRSKIMFFDNIPVLSYIILFGRCRRCGKRISLIYPFVEILTALTAAFLFKKYGLTMQSSLYFVFICALIVVSFIDLKHFIIPDSISLSGIVVGLAFSFFESVPVSPLESFLGILLGGGILLLIGVMYEKFTGREGIGGGDIKLLAMMGAFLGYQSIFLILLLSSVCGAVIGLLILFIVPGRNKESMIPFGPFLSLGALVAVVYGKELIEMYLKMLYV